MRSVCSPAIVLPSLPGPKEAALHIHAEKCTVVEMAIAQRSLASKPLTFSGWRWADRTHGAVHQEIHPVCVRPVEKMPDLQRRKSQKAGCKSPALVESGNYEAATHGALRMMMPATFCPSLYVR